MVLNRPVIMPPRVFARPGIADERVGCSQPSMEVVVFHGRYVFRGWLVKYYARRGSETRIE
jgi:hypothetical protein